MTPNKNAYKELLGFMESGNDYSIINSIGALGRFQFMPTTLNSLQNLYSLPAWKNANYFVSNPELQDIYFNALFSDSLNFLKQNNLEKYSGQIKTGSKRFKNITTPINVYGMLAAIHLSGGGNLKKYFLFGNDPNDGQTSLSDYLVYFSQKLQSSVNPILFLLAFIPAIVLYYN